MKMNLVMMMEKQPSLQINVVTSPRVVAFVMPEKVILIARRTFFASITFAHQREISEGVQIITIIFVAKSTPA